MQGTAVDDPEQQMTRKPDDKEPLAGLAFKIMADQFQVWPPSIALFMPPVGNILTSDKCVVVANCATQGLMLLCRCMACHAFCIVTSLPLYCINVVQQLYYDCVFMTHFLVAILDVRPSAVC
jgi:hypothetical protein